VPATLIKTGTGALAFDTVNSYTGGTVISQGTITSNVVAVPSVIQGTLTFNDANTGSADTTFVASCLFFPNPIVVADAGSGTPTLASSAAVTPFGPTVFTGPVTIDKGLTVLAQNANALNALHEPGQTRFDGPISGAGGLTIAGGNMVQFRNAAKTYTGPTRVTGNTTLALYDAASTPANSAVTIDAGSTVVLEGLPSGTLGSLAGAGTLANNPAHFQSLVAVGNNNADTAFTGQITGRVRLSKAGTGTLALGPQDNASLTLSVSAGRVRLTGDHRLESVFVDTAAPGTQKFDLAGRAVRIFTGGLQGLGLEGSLYANIRQAAIGDGDGILDSTAAARPGTRVGIALTIGTGLPLIMRLTLAGDANVNGAVDFDDLVKLAQNYNSGPGNFWDDGDFNYDYEVDFNDLVLLAQNYNTALPTAPIPGSTTMFQYDLAAAFASVPEPALIPLAAFALSVLPRPRHRRTQRD
jgi:autotransporter-associated beta strand protein